MAEKISSAYHLVVAENSNEEAEMSKCKSAVKRIRKMEKDVEEACSTGDNLFLLPAPLVSLALSLALIHMLCLCLQ